MRLSTVASFICATLAVPFALAQDVTHAIQPAAADVASPSAPEAVDAFVEQLMKKRHIPGASVAVVKDGKVVLAKGYGLADVELGVPATEETVYQLASVTKTFTATAIMMLVRDGIISLDDKVTEQLSGLPETWSEVTLRHLLTHTSGIKSYTSVKDFEKAARKDFEQREIIALVAKDPLEFTPGERWNYSNTGYFLLGMVIEKASGKPYGEFMTERIFKPLGMERTRLNDLRAVIANRARGYEWNGNALSNGEYVSPTQPFAAGALVSTVVDLAKWDAALTEHSLLDEDTQDQMWTAARLREGEAGYGYGWQIAKLNGHRLISHGGGIPGFSTQFSRFVDDKLTVIVLTNAEGGHAQQLARGVAGHFVPAIAAKAVEPIADKDPETTERLRAVLEGAQRGNLPSEHFTGEAQQALVPRIKQDKQRVAAFGPLKAFDLLDRQEGADGVRLTYRATFENETLQVSFALDKNGKIAGIRLAPQD